jgi:hypothetical protein
MRVFSESFAAVEAAAMRKSPTMRPALTRGSGSPEPSDRFYDRMMNGAFVALVLCLCALEGVQRTYLHGHHVYWPLFGGGFQATAGMLGLFTIHWLRAVSPKERTALFFATIVIGLSLARLPALGFKNTYALLGLALTLASTAVNTIWILREKGITRLRLRNVRDAWFVLLAGLLAGPMLELSTYYGPLSDMNIFVFEEHLGIRVESLVHAVVAQFPFGHEILDWVYGATEAIFGVSLFTSKPRANPFVPALIGVGTIGYCLYALCPAIGIQLPAYYQSIQSGANLVPADFAYRVGFSTVPRNCVPSIHAACAYLMLFNAWRFRPALRRCVVAFGILTLCSAIEIGLHWFTDLVIAFPYAIATMALTNPDLATHRMARLKIVGIGYACTLFWMIGIREDWTGAVTRPALEWAFIIVTVGVGLVMLSWHDRALGRRVVPLFSMRSAWLGTRQPV